MDATDDEKPNCDKEVSELDVSEELHIDEEKLSPSENIENKQLDANKQSEEISHDNCEEELSVSVTDDHKQLADVDQEASCNADLNSNLGIVQKSNTELCDLIIQTETSDTVLVQKSMLDAVEQNVTKNIDKSVTPLDTSDQDTKSDIDEQLPSDIDTLDISSGNEKPDILTEEKVKLSKQTFTKPPVESGVPTTKEWAISRSDKDTPDLPRNKPMQFTAGDFAKIPQVYSMKFQLDIENTNPVIVIHYIESCIGKGTIINLQASLPNVFCCSTLFEKAYQKLCEDGFMFKDKKIQVYPTLANVRALRIISPLSIGENVIRRKLNKKYGRVASITCDSLNTKHVWIVIMVITKPLPEEVSFSNTLLPIEVGKSTF